ncbi:MAG: PAS domain S-box protein [Bacteroidia bacterium]|nr:PAS domain S-box protein [Bacteroidia bacterium]
MVTLYTYSKKMVYRLAQIGKRKRSFISFSVILFLIITILVLIFSALDKANSRKMASKYLISVTDGVTQNVDSWIEEKKKMLMLISDLPETKEAFTHQQEYLNIKFDLIKTYYYNVENIFLALPDGNIATGALYSDTALTNLTQLDLWPDFQKSNFALFLDTYICRSQRTGKLTFILLKGVFNETGTLLGFVGFTINWDKFINKFIIPAQVGETGYLAITDTLGRNIGHHDESLTLRSMGEYPWMQKLVKEKNGFQRYRFKEEVKLMAFQESKETGWIIMSSINENELIEATARTRNLILIFSVILLIVFLIMIVYLDMFKLEAAERNLIESERNFNLLFERGNDGIYLHSITPDRKAGCFFNVNKAFLSQFNTTYEKVIASTPYDIFIGNHRAYYDQILGQVLEEKHQIIETKLVIGGFMAYVEFNLFLIEAKRETSVMGFVRDITDRVTAKHKLKEDRDYLNEKVQERTREILHANEKLRGYIREKDKMANELSESEAKYRVIIERANDGIVLINRRKIVFVNQKICSMLNYSAEVLTGRYFAEIIAEKDRNWVIQNHEKRLKGMFAPNFFETQLLTSEEKTLDVEINAGVFPSQEGNQDFIFIRDITLRKKNEEEQRRHNEQMIQTDKLVALGTLVSGVAHEINNPNNAIMLNSPIIREAWKSTRPILERYKQENGDFVISGMPYSFFKEYFDDIIDDIQNSSEKIKTIVEDLKNFARPDSGSNFDAVDVNAMIRSAIKMVSSMLTKATTDFSFDADTTLPSVQGNFFRLEQVVVNLLQNACHALRSRDNSIRIKTAFSRCDQSVIIGISDQGTGISKENLKQIFDPFFTTKREKGGTGLGLSVSLKIIKEHGGSIVFDSVEGQGTTVTIKLPVIQDVNEKFIPC